MPAYTTGLCEMFNYSYLETLYAVEAEGSYENAARARGVSRSAISQNIQLLEDRWGSAAMARNPVRPIKLGHRLCRHVDQVRFLETKLMLEHGHLFDTSEFDPVPVRLLVDRSAVPSGLLETIGVLSNQSNAFIFQSDLVSRDNIQEAMSQDSIKTVLSTQCFCNSELLANTLGYETFSAVASPAFVKRIFKHGVEKSGLIDSVSVSYSSDTNYCADFIEQVYGQAVMPNTNFLPSNFGMINACLEGKSWAVLPRSLISDHLQLGSLVELLPGELFKINLFWYVNRFIAAILPEMTRAALNAAAQCLTPQEDECLSNAC